MNREGAMVSSENERHLCQLLLSSSATASSALRRSGCAQQVEGAEVLAAVWRVYDKFVLKGCSSAQIEQALSALSVRIPEQIYNVVTGQN
jgi:putative ubiquitin-RnfH superfamily antitoxin RatB of RatAB toxin-antitoxin module